MGFKRTNDGRVFFQGLDEPSNEDEMQPRLLEETPKSGPSQMQILALLKSLNERLKSTQAERNYMRRQLEAYREVIEALEDRSDKNEQSYAKLEKALLAAGGTDSDSNAPSSPTMQRTEALMKETLKEMGETRKLLLEIEGKAESASRTTSSLQKIQQDQAQKMANTTASYAQMLKRLEDNELKQDNISEQLEDTIAQQAKMSRKIDKVGEDRARFMRKIERIEETVIQTRDALNAKAMVLLTDQGAAGGVEALDENQTLGEALLRQKNQGDAEIIAPHMVADVTSQKRNTKRQTYVSLAVLGTLLAGAVFSGWMISQWYKPATLNAVNTTQNTALKDTAALQNQTTNQQATPINRAAEAPQDWRIERDTDAFTPTPATATIVSQDNMQALDALDDIGTMSVEDDRAILELLEGSPDAVAAALNEIEPGMQQQASLDAPARALSKPAFDPSKYTPVSGTDAVQPDPNLPEVIKQVEEQAFAGSPEAQHDLAAIYTAGHAGVAQDYDRAAFWFRKAADQGIANARYNLGVLHHQGLGVRPNMKEAIYWYDQASQLGHPEAQYNLGIAYIEGIGVTYSPAKAADNFEQAARGGVMEAAYNLGLIYENGLMGTSAPDKALMWYKLAADQGSPEAKAALEQLATALNIQLADVNRIVDDIQGVQTNTAPTARQPIAPPPAPQAQPAPVEATITAEEASAIEAVTNLTASMSADQEFAQMTLAQIQEQLMRLGLYPGPADGVLGPLTSDAIRAYQRENDLPVNGRADEAVLSHMLSQEVQPASGN